MKLKFNKNNNLLSFDFFSLTEHLIGILSPKTDVWFDGFSSTFMIFLRGITITVEKISKILS